MDENLLPKSEKEDKSKTRKMELPSPPVVEPKKAVTLKLETNEKSTGQSVSGQENATSNQEPKSNGNTINNEDRATSEQEKTMMEIASRISLAQSATISDDEDVKKSSKRKELLPAGKIFQGKYEIVKLIGSGGMGQVYLANHTALGSKVAIKILNSNVIGDDDEEAVDRFKREARATAAIDHVNAVRVFDFGVEEGVFYLVLEFLDGESLRKRLARRKRFAISEVVTLVEQVCSVLEVMHRKGIVHRDLKPDNIFFHKQEDREVVKVLDFGIAKVNGGTLIEGRLTSTGALLGTPHYMSPEQCQGMKLDGRSDLYSFGIIIYELLSGTLPFSAENTLSMLFKHVRDNPKPISELVPDLPLTLADVVMKELEKNPNKRFQTAKEFAQAFCESANGSKPINIQENNTVKVDTDELAYRSTIETAILANENKLDEDSQKDEIPQKIAENKLYDVSTRSHQASNTRPVGRAIPNEIDVPTALISANKPIDKDVYSVVEKQRSLETVTPASNFFVKYLIPTALIAVVALLGVWKLMPQNTQSAPQNTPIVTQTNKPTGIEDILLKENFVLIPAASATIGNNGKDCGNVPDCKIENFEEPAHTVDLLAYYLNKFEVTNAEYQEFVKQTNVEPPKSWNGKEFPRGTENLPVTDVTWKDAVAYCEWLTKTKGEKNKIEYRLPTEEEWEYAASGNKRSIFPWGDIWNEKRVQGGKIAGTSAPIGTNEAPNNKDGDCSEFGIIAMAGNVQEWTNSDFKPYPGSSYKPQKDDLKCKVIRGGAFSSKPNEIRNTRRSWDLVTSKDAKLGFRLVAVSKK